MKKIVLVAGLMIAGFTTPALACSCVDTSRQAVIDESDAVFTGTVESVEPAGFWNIATVKVDEVSKGELKERVKVASALSGAACGVRFNPGDELEIAAIQRKNRYYTDLCAQMGLKQKPAPAPLDD